jgi:phytoene dehydrogenase-like protein
MTPDADIVVAGAGHNSLLAACYLAKAGYSCLVLDARPIPGGGAATEELVLPGFGIDTCATGHTMIRVNPALLADELGLIADYGLSYAEPDPVEQVAFPDGEQLTMWLDRERTIEEVARFSRADAVAYRRLLDEYDEVKSIFSRSQFTPVGFGPSLDAIFDAGLFADGVSNEIRANNVANVQARGADGFNVPSLISVFASAPYLHSGAAPTLDAVLENVTHRSAGSGGVDTLTNFDDRRQLVRFLESIDRTTTPFAAGSLPTGICGPK